ncbi:MAG: hypothetical protein MUF84_02170 [Anaerolineae bacterium]|jgi:hypothetical protein|nr:hypothetical protein [Anaerolineae bacterium]
MEFGSGASGTSGIYEFRLEGRLDARVARRFEGLCAMALRSGKTLLVGPIADQSALYGTLDRIRDTGAVLLGMRRIGARRGQA